MPDPRHGVFETLLIVDGRPVELEAHLARLARSLNELFPGHALPDLDQMHVRVKNGAMRIDVAPRADRLDARISFREIEQRSETAALFSLRVPGGLGPHKWRDRSLLDEKQAQLPTRGLPLLLDEDDTALEAARANVFGVREETLLTPPTDGRILPGVTRMRVIELAGEVGIDTYEAELSRADLLTADEVFLTGSVRGIEPAASLDGAVLGAGGPVVAALATELRRAWLGAPVA